MRDNIKSFERLAGEYNLQVFTNASLVSNCHRERNRTATVKPSLSDYVNNGFGAWGFHILCNVLPTDHYHLYIISYATMLTWSKDLNIDVTHKEWDGTCENIKRVSRDIKIRWIQFKILNRFYWTPSRLFRLKLRDNADCWKCYSSEGTLLHLLWECPMVQN